jgi:diphosphomevalonate decarboxylase
VETKRLELNMEKYQATAIAHPNIALIKYWGNRDHEMRIPENGSISFNLGSLYTKTTVIFNPSLENDSLEINGIQTLNSGLKRISNFLKIVREWTSTPYYARVISENNFPMGAGIASSAAAFASLSLASIKALGLFLTEKDLSRLARRGSGSACRSIPQGFVEWLPGRDDQESFSYSFAPVNHWNLVDVIAIVAKNHKSVGSTAGHALANSSPLQRVRVADAPRRLGIGKNAILQRDFNELAEIVELDSNLMHSVMMTSSPSLFYWEPATISIMKAVPEWRQQGIPACYTLDAGPNVHIICQSEYADDVANLVNQITGVLQVMVSPVGGGAYLVEE